MVIQDSKNGEILINPQSIRLVQAQMHKDTKEEMWCDIFFEGISEPVAFYVKYEELKKQLI